MLPYLYQSQNFTIGSYGVMLAIAYLTGRHLYLRRLNQIIKPPINTEILIFSLLTFGVIGAKLMFILKNHQIDSFFDFKTLTAPTGFSSQGAIIAALFVITIYSRWCKIPLDKLLDSAAPAAIMAYAIARIGCFLSGDDCWGIDSQLPWAMSFPNGIKPTAAGQTVHPLPLYEVIYSLIIWYYLTVKQKTTQPPFAIFFSLLILWGGCRFLIEFISTNPIKLLGMTGSQFGALVMFIISILYFTFNSYSKVSTLSTDKKKPA